MDVVVILCTFSDPAAARLAAQALVGEQLAACVSIVPGVASIYRWEGRVEESAEALCVLKTTRAAWPRCRDRLRELHAYEVPEILAFEPFDSSEAYRNWVIASVAHPPEQPRQESDGG